MILNLKLVEQIILILKTELNRFEIENRKSFKIENGKIVLKLKTEKSFWTEKRLKNRVITTIRIDISKWKNLSKRKKKILKTVFYLKGVLNFKKLFCGRFKILKTVLKMFKPRFEKNRFCPFLLRTQLGGILTKFL